MQNWRGISTIPPTAVPIVLQTDTCVQAYGTLLQTQCHLVLINVLLCESPVDYCHTQHSLLLGPCFLGGIYMTSTCFDTEYACSVSGYI